MNTLDQIIDTDKAPIMQWAPVVGEPLSEGKKKEDAITHGAILRELFNLPAQKITNLIADEGRLALRMARYLEQAELVTHLTLHGAFERAAKADVVHALTRPEKEIQDFAQKVQIRTNTDDILPGTQDVVVMNMILGCLATPDGHDNLRNILKMSAELLRPSTDINYGGHLVLVRPNPEGGALSTYETVTPADELKAGKDYGFIVKGLEDEGTMCNLYTPDSFLRPLLDEAGFDMGTTKPIADQDENGQDMQGAPAFLLNVCRLR